MAKIYITPGDEGGYLARTPLLLGAVAHEQNEKDAAAAVIRRAEEQAATYRELNLPLPKEYPPSDWSLEQVPDATVPEDYVPLDDVTLSTGLNLLGHSHQRLLKVVERFSSDALSWPIPGARRFKNAAEVLDHIAHADTWYISRLKDWPREPAARLKAVRSAILEHVRALKPDALNLKTYNYLEEWTPRKVLRLVLESAPLNDLLEGLSAFEKGTGTVLPAPPSERPCVSLLQPETKLQVYVRYIEWRNRFYAAITQLPGLAAEGTNRDLVLERIPALVQDGLSYLRLTSQPELSLEARGIEIIEVNTALLPQDELPLAPADLQPYFDAIDRATQLHVSFLEELPQVWEWKTGEGQSLYTMALNWANQEWWHLRCLQLWPRDPIERLRAARAWVIERYKNLTSFERDRVTLHVGEEWTARKALRRAIEHEREHIWHLEEILGQYNNAVGKN